MNRQEVTPEKSATPQSSRTHAPPSAHGNRSVCLFGVDEAGYGPLLGPLVLVTVGLRISQAAPLKELNRRLRRSLDPNAGVRVADSKAIYRGVKDFERLELNALALWYTFLGTAAAPTTLRRLWRCCTGRSDRELAAFPWHRPSLQIPLCAEPPRILAAAETVRQRWDSAGITPLVAHARVVFPPEFNRVCESRGSKNKALLHWTIELLRTAELEPHERTILVMDQQGGRKDYSAVLEALQPSSGFQLYGPTANRRRAVRRRDRLTIVVEPRADANYFVVSACSMMAKYLRELFMHQWNTYWREKAALARTSGYAQDAKAYIAQLRDLAKRQSDLRREVESALELYLRHR